MRLTATTILILLLAACGRDSEPAATSTTSSETTSVSSATLTPEQLGEIGAQIRKDPSSADAVLSRHGMTREAFEKAIRDVTEDPEASRRYAEAYRRGSA